MDLYMRSGVFKASAAEYDGAKGLQQPRVCGAQLFRDDDVGVVTHKLISERSNQEILLDGICRDSEGSFNDGKLCYKNV